MDRRSFIKLTAVTGTSAALASCGNPENHIIRFLPGEDIVPGMATWKPGVCTLCRAGCGLTVRVMDAEADVLRNGQAGIVRVSAAKKLEGAPEHPLNRGGLCPRGQAGIQITVPSGPDHAAAQAFRFAWRWSVCRDLLGRCDWRGGVAAQCARGGWESTVARVSRAQRRKSSRRSDAAISRAFRRTGPVTCELFGDEVLRRANALTFGREQLPTFDLANARHVLSFGADFLGTWNSPVAQSVGYGEMRRGRPGIRGSFVQVESRMSQTGANADEWVPVRPGTEGVLALGVAHLIMAEKLLPISPAASASRLLAGWNEGLADYSPQRVEEITGVSAARLARLARRFAEESPAVAIAGGPALAHTNGLFTALAVNALNTLVGNIDRPGGISFTPQFDVAAAVKAPVPSATAAPALAQWRAALASGSTPEVLFLDGVNPVFTAPPAWRVRESLDKVPYIVSFGSFLDETSVMADLILPDHSFLESWMEAVPESGAHTSVASVAPAVMRPLYDTRATPDVLLDIGRRLQRPLELPWQSFEEMLAASFGALPPATPDVDAWTDAQGKGMWSGTLPAALARQSAAAVNTPAVAQVYEEPRFDGEASEYPFHLLPYASSTFFDGSLAHLPWLQEMPDPLTSAMWSSWIEINPTTAAKLGLGEGDVVESHPHKEP